ncbi:ankyrin repeat domain-containing protein [Wolbachia endosymbiont (group B) of Melanostoma mellinum]|uniref:ankyrin repeat domain-containing protein n=1 Tax=Wolbachia endosymbiont (group B) of Melanostoma mellinum TaxID=2954030 RepID=UPI0022309392|nr:ankyrin repeat domain-containing protein [Wolbachia endosymbiont (group B) of Melanostoma mellinum]
MINELFAAVRSGDANQVADLINKGDDVNARDNRGNTPLHLAVLADKLQVVEKLIERGADINAKNNHGGTPLHWAALNQNVSIVEKLIEKGANVNEKNKYDNVPLHYAAFFNGCLCTAEKLIEKGANVNAKNNDGATPLHWAALHDNLQVAGLFINKRANVNAKDENGWTPLHTAAARGNLGVVKLILDKSDYVDARGALAVANTLNEENSLEIRNLLEERIRRNEEITQHLNLQEESSSLSTRVHNRLSIAQEDENSLQNDKIGPDKIGVTSGTSKPSSFINIFAYTTVDTIKGIFQFVSSYPFRGVARIKNN